MNSKLSLALEITADPAKLKAGLAVSRKDILSTYADLMAGLSEAQKQLAAAQLSAQAMARELSNAGPPTRQMVADFDRARAAVVAAKDAVETKTVALQRQRGTAQQNAQAIVAATERERQAVVAAVATEESARRAAHQRRMADLLQQVAAAKASAEQQAAAARSLAAQQAQAAAAQQARALMLTPTIRAGQSVEMGRLAAEARNAATAVDGVTRNTAALAAQSAALAPLNTQMRTIAAGLASVATLTIGSMGAAELVRLSDAYTGVNSRLKVYAQSNADLATAQREVFRISQDYGRELTGTATLLGRVVQPLRDMGRASGDAVKVTDAVAASLRIAGATASESTASQIQFGQAISANTLQGEELNSVLENSPPLARALAAAMRVSVGDLKNMGKEGQLTGQIIVDALLSQADALRDRALKMESTIGESLTRIQNAFMKTFGERSAGSTSAIAGGLTLLADNMRSVIDVAELAGAAMLAAFGVRLVASVTAVALAKQAAILAEQQAAAAALVSAQANARAAAAESARTLTTKRLAAAQLEVAAAEKAAQIAAGGVVARAGAGLLGLLGGPIGAIATALTLGVTAWQIWGNRAKESTDAATASVADLVKELQSFGENMSAEQRTKKFEDLAASVAKARAEELRFWREARQAAEEDWNIVDTVAAAESDDRYKAARKARLDGEKLLSDELKALEKKLADERSFLFKSLIEKEKALNGELVVDEKAKLAERQKDNQSAADAVRSAWQKTLDEIKAKQAEVSAAPTKAAERQSALGSRAEAVRTAGMSAEDRAVYQALQAQAAAQDAVLNRTRASFELQKAYSQQLRGDLGVAKQSFDAAEKDLQKAFDKAEKAGDAGMMEEIAARLADVDKARGQIAEKELAQLQQQGDAQRSKMNELQAAGDDLKKKLAGIEVDVKIDKAIANLQSLQGEAAKLQAMLSSTAAGNAAASAPPAPIPGRAFGGPLPGQAPHDRADNMLYWGTPGEWVIQRPAVRYYGAGVIAAINAMRVPKFAYGGGLGLAGRLQVPQVRSVSAGQGGGDVLDLGALGSIRIRQTPDTRPDAVAVLRRAAQMYGRK